MALKYGTLQSLNRSNSDDDKLLEQKFGREEYSDVVGTALTAMPAVRRLFAGETFYRMEGKYTDRLLELEIPSSGEVSFKVLEIELQMIYDDLYTKATVLRTRSGIIFRCISQVSVIVALVLFLVSNKQRYSKADVWITYVLFLGGFCMEVCGAFMIIAVSPWTWLWFKTRQWRWLTGVSWHILCQIGMPENRKLWSNQMGQYTAASYLGHYSGSSSSWKQWMMKRIIRTVNFLGVGKGTLFWFSKVLDTNYVKVDRKIMEAICQGVDHFHPYTNYSPRKRNFQNLAQLLELIESPSRTDLGYAILLLHAFTEVHLYKYSVLPTAPAEATGNIEIEDTLHIMVEICRKLSNYMLYLLATNQEMLSVSGSTKQFFEGFREINIDGNDDNALVNKFDQELRELGLTHQPQLCKETLEELRDIWIRLLIYAAGKSRPQMHAGQIARGGELLTFAWLIMLHCSVGDSGMRRIELSSTGVFGRQRDVAYVFNVEQSSARSV
ncbi:hypothetical protein QOZ80_8AG0617180 [Eleusine coracana subsp. coracana]|nr:hypothetical protein QOZ80_8AG0617180 [Eleusine coracana subsp. coracana]